jgi:hypothetical protein
VFAKGVGSILQGLVGKDIIRFRIQPVSGGVDAFQIVQMNFPSGPLPKIESKYALNAL